MELAYEASSALCRHLMAQGRHEPAAAVVQALHFFVAKLRERQTRFEGEECVAVGVWAWGCGCGGVGVGVCVWAGTPHHTAHAHRTGPDRTHPSPSTVD